MHKQHIIFMIQGSMQNIRYKLSLLNQQLCINLNPTLLLSKSGNVITTKCKLYLSYKLTIRLTRDTFDYFLYKRKLRKRTKVNKAIIPITSAYKPVKPVFRREMEDMFVSTEDTFSLSVVTPGRGFKI
jgi:hypothetical protein